MSFTYFKFSQFHVTYLLNTTIIVFRFLKDPFIQNSNSGLIFTPVHSSCSLDEKECAGKRIYTTEIKIHKQYKSLLEFLVSILKIHIYVIVSSDFKSVLQKVLGQHHCSVICCLVFFSLTDFPIQPLYYLKAAEAIVTRSHVCNSKWKHAFWFPLLQVVLCKRDLFHHCQQLLMQKTDAQEAKRFGHQWEKKRKIKVYLYYLVK